MRVLRQFSKKAVAIAHLEAGEGVNPCWSGTCLVLGRAFAHQRDELVEHLSAAITRCQTGNSICVSPLFDSPFLQEALPRLQGCTSRFDDCPAAIALSSRALVIRVPRHEVVHQDALKSIASALTSFKFKPRKCVLVTGAGGMLGRHVKDVMAQEPEYADCDGVFVARHDGDLCSKVDVDRMLARYQPTHVLHCAGMRDSLHGMNSRLVDFWLGNVAMNDNVLRASHEVQAYVGAGVKVVSILSTVMFQRDCEYPMTAEADRLYGGRHHAAAESYAAAKKALAQLSQWYRMQHGDAFTSVLPGNFYGEYGDFNPSIAPLVNALIARAEKARTAGTSDLPLKVMGTGRPLRQVQHARDLARACLWALGNYDEFDPLIVAGEEVSVRRTAELVCEATGYRGGLAFDEGAVDGPLRRTADTTRYRSLCPGNKDFELLEGIKRTVAWYRRTQEHGCNVIVPQSASFVDASEKLGMQACSKVISINISAS
jgi:GDP-L-fucose synthase